MNRTVIVLVALLLAAGAVATTPPGSHHGAGDRDIPAMAGGVDATIVATSTGFVHLDADGGVVGTYPVGDVRSIAAVQPQAAHWFAVSTFDGFDSDVLLYAWEPGVSATFHSYLASPVDASEGWGREVVPLVMDEHDGQEYLVALRRDPSYDCGAPMCTTEVAVAVDTWRLDAAGPVYIGGPYDDRVGYQIVPKCSNCPVGWEDHATPPDAIVSLDWPYLAVDQARWSVPGEVKVFEYNQTGDWEPFASVTHDRGVTSDFGDHVTIDATYPYTPAPIHLFVAEPAIGQVTGYRYDGTAFEPFVDFTAGATGDLLGPIRVVGENDQCRRILVGGGDNPSGAAPHHYDAVHVFHMPVWNGGSALPAIQDTVWTTEPLAQDRRFGHRILAADGTSDIVAIGGAEPSGGGWAVHHRTAAPCLVQAFFEAPSPCGEEILAPAGQTWTMAVRATTDKEGHDASILLEGAPAQAYLVAQAGRPATGSLSVPSVPDGTSSLVLRADTPGNSSAVPSPGSCTFTVTGVGVQADFDWHAAAYEPDSAWVALDAKGPLHSALVDATWTWTFSDGGVATGRHPLVSLPFGDHDVCLHVRAYLHDDLVDDERCGQLTLAPPEDQAGTDVPVPGGPTATAGRPKAEQGGQVAARPAVSAATPLPEQDVDRDGVPDGSDNCVWIPNPAQADLDRDDAGDVCDDDIDGDGWPQAGVGVPDNCPAAANADQADIDGDGTGDACDDETGTVRAPLQAGQHQRGVDVHFLSAPSAAPAPSAAWGPAQTALVAMSAAVAIAFLAVLWAMRRH